MEKLIGTWDVHQSAGEPHTAIRVSNLQTILPLATDAWGRNQIPQPALITCAISLGDSFYSASVEDAVTQSTVHYGMLSKAILAACQSLSGLNLATPMPLGWVLCTLQYWLTGISPAGELELSLPKVPALQSVRVKLLELEITLPKASLLGSGVNMKGAFLYDKKNTVVTAYAMMLTICNLKIPTLIGINSNERLAKQIVIATVKIDRCNNELEEAFSELEQLVFKTIEESCFQTLEALAELIGQKIVKYYLCPRIFESPKVQDQHIVWPSIRIELSKPTAVTLADAPTVEMLIDLEKEATRQEEIKLLQKTP